MMMRDPELGLGLQEDVDQLFTPPGDELAVEMAPVKEPETPGEWLKLNLFSSWFNSLLTAVAGVFVLFALYQATRFVFVSGEWGVIRTNLKGYLAGGFPVEELWRVWFCVYLTALLGGVSYGVTGRTIAWSRRRIVIAAAIAVAVIAFVLWATTTFTVRALAFAIPIAVALGIVVGKALGPGVKRRLLIVWIVAFPLMILVVRGFGGVTPRIWGGFFFNLLAATVGIFASFPIGIGLALGRRSELPGIRLICVVFIEIFRGVPLVAWLIFSKYVVDLLLPPQIDLPDIIKSLIAMTLFSSAYVAEIVRGGLQGIHSGQYEAGRALGLSTPRLMGLVILPQALRSTIPAMIGHFISLFKDTSLFSAIEVTDLLEGARRSASDPRFFGTDMETLLFAALLFWMVAFSMGRWSQRLELRLGVGER